MAIRPDYLIRETGQNLFRNRSLTIASVLTVAVSLALLGSALLIQKGVDRVDTYFRSGVEFNVWMDIGVNDEQVAIVSDALDSHPMVRSFTYVDDEATFKEFQAYFADYPDILNLFTDDQVPTSFRVMPADVAVESVQAIGESLKSFAGVSEVNYAVDDIKAISEFSNGSSRIMLFAALASSIAAFLLMYNTIRTAVFARRREIEVMRLVGATKWFIRLPFMIEGLIQGLIGSVMSIITVFALNKALDEFFSRQNFRAFQTFALTASEIFTIGGVLLVVGAFLGAVGAAVAVTNYLEA